VRNNNVYHLELYNLREDIRETHNLAEKLPEKARALHKLLDKWRKDINVKMPI